MSVASCRFANLMTKWTVHPTLDQHILLPSPCCTPAGFLPVMTFVIGIFMVSYFDLVIIGSSGSWRHQTVILPGGWGWFGQGRYKCWQEHMMSSNCHISFTLYQKQEKLCQYKKDFHYFCEFHLVTLDWAVEAAAHTSRSVMMNTLSECFQCCRCSMNQPWYQQF